MEDKYEKKPGKGYLWHETESKIIRKGSIYEMIEVDKDEYVAIVKTSVGGEDKYEVMYSLGLVYINDEKRTSNSPDISGPIRVPTGFKPMKFAGWKSEQKDGREGTSVSITEPKEKNEERF